MTTSARERRLVRDPGADMRGQRNVLDRIAAALLGRG